MAETNEPFLPTNTKDDSKVEGTGGSASVTVFGVDLGRFSPQNQLFLLAGGAVVTSIVFSLVQERVMPQGSNALLVSWLTTIFFALCGLVECFLTNTKRRVPLKDYAQLSMFTAGGMIATNAALAYVSYPLRVIAKSIKVVPVMLVGVCIQNKRYTTLEYLSAIVLVSGIAIFTLGDAKVSPTFSVTGLLLLALGVACDAITANVEEKLFKMHRCTQAEVMVGVSFFGSFWAFAGIVYNGKVTEAFDQMINNPNVVVGTATFSVFGYMASALILAVISAHGAVAAEIVKSLRKVATIVLSFVLVSKPISPMHVLGGFIFAFSIAMTVYIKRQKSRLAK
mmetsp:Transcript_24009/g.42338  ORF Transcript_24009/g.42338 Transcript_24009/m.42338 type:complete len:338 (-) Transcript_24009:75-1088(-)